MSVLGFLTGSTLENRAEKALSQLGEHWQRLRDECRLASNEVALRNRDINRPLPPTGALPKAARNTIVVPRNDYFTGREDILQQLHEAIGPQQGNLPSRQKSCVLCGLAGSGKTETAIEYTFRYRDQYDFIFWLRSESPPELAENYSAIASVRELGPPGSSVNQRRNIERAWKWLSDTGNT